jgi:hypothetical protein
MAICHHGPPLLPDGPQRQRPKPRARGWMESFSGDGGVTPPVTLIDVDAEVYTFFRGLPKSETQIWQNELLLGRQCLYG